MHIVLGLVAGFAGLFAGMLINVLADDLPRDSPVLAPHYPDSTPRPRIAWSGLLAFVTGHRRSPGGAKLSWRQPLVEIGMIVLFVYIAVGFPFEIRSVVWMIDLTILVLITVIDLETRLILFVVIFPAYAIALIGSALVGAQSSEQIVFRDYLIGGAGGFLLFFLMYQGGRLFNATVVEQRGLAMEAEPRDQETGTEGSTEGSAEARQEVLPAAEPTDQNLAVEASTEAASTDGQVTESSDQDPEMEEAFGYGDVLLGTLCGLMLGWQALVFAAMITIFVGAAGSLLYIVARLVVKGRYEMLTPLPYGQYIVLGTMIMMLWREPVKAFLQR